MRAWKTGCTLSCLIELLYQRKAMTAGSVLHHDISCVLKMGVLVQQDTVEVFQCFRCCDRGRACPSNTGPGVKSPMLLDRN
jgi:hypothetical protein